MIKQERLVATHSALRMVIAADEEEEQRAEENGDDGVSGSHASLSII